MFAGVGLLGWGIARYPGAAIAALAAMTLWGVFGTRGDGLRGDPVVNTPGPLRLALETALFGLAAAGIWMEWSRAASETFMTIAVLHYGITWERQRWLIVGGRSSGSGGK